MFKLKRRFLRIFLVLILLVAIAFFFSYRLLEVPTGLTIDEAAFGYNATLLARTGHDQNGNFLPFFVLSIEGRDWRQPVTQYYMALFFKIFGSSVFNLRFTSVIVTIISVILLFLLANKLLGEKGAFFSALVFLLTPLIMIQSHLGLDNIMPIPFEILWLLSVFLFLKTEKRKYLISAAMCLGIGFYTYKGMRAVVPVWCVLTVIYLLVMGLMKSKKYLKKIFLDVIIFSLVIFPFFAITPILEAIYPGAVFDHQQPVFDSIYDFLYPYFSSFDLTFLFIKGDVTLYHSTQQHGMMLLSTLPLFLIGCYQAIRKKGFWLFILVAFFSAPFLYGFVNSVHRASRLMVIIPPYALLASLGAIFLWQQRKWWKGKLLLLIIVVLMFINYFDFVRYYWFTYPKFTENIFGHLNIYKSYEVLAQESKIRNLKPCISSTVYEGGGESGYFFEAIYFSSPLKKIYSEQDARSGSILLTNRQEIPGMRMIGKVENYYLQIKE